MLHGLGSVCGVQLPGMAAALSGPHGSRAAYVPLVIPRRCVKSGPLSAPGIALVNARRCVHLSALCLEHVRSVNCHALKCMRVSALHGVIALMHPGGSRFKRSLCVLGIRSHVFLWLCVRVYPGVRSDRLSIAAVAVCAVLRSVHRVWLCPGRAAAPHRVRLCLHLIALV